MDSIIQNIYQVLQKKKIRVLFCFFLFAIYSIIFFSISNFSNFVPFFGDPIEYQSIGVNFAKGHGIQKFGGIENFSEYSFLENVNKPENQFFVNTSITDFCSNKTNDFYREPAYPFFLGIIYKIFGVIPIIVKYIQLILLILIAALLPYIGYKFWNISGFLSGLFSSPLYIYYNFNFADGIMTEALTSFSIFFIICSYILYNHKKNTFSSIILGLSFGIGLLVKGNLTLIPFIYFIYLIYSYLKKKDKIILKHLQITAISFFITILPWTIYSNITLYRDIKTEKQKEINELKNNKSLTISIKKNIISRLQNNNYRFFLVSTQSQRLLLNGHNEYVPALTQNGQYIFPEGGWLPKWETIKESFYNNDKMQGKSSIKRVINFYKHYPHLIFKLIIDKVILSFSHFKFLWLIILLYLLELYGIIINNFTNKYIKLIYDKLLILLLFFGILGIIYIFPPDRNIISIYKILTFIIFPAIIIKYFAKNNTMLLKIPPILNIIFINFLLTSIIVFGFQRFTQVMDFIILIVSFEYLIKFLNDKYFKFYFKQNRNNKKQKAYD